MEEDIFEVLDSQTFSPLEFCGSELSQLSAFQINRTLHLFKNNCNSSDTHGFWKLKTIGNRETEVYGSLRVYDKLVEILVRRKDK